MLQHKWESAFTIDSANWGFARDDNLDKYLNITTILSNIVSTVAYGGNVSAQCLRSTVSLSYAVAPVIDGYILSRFMCQHTSCVQVLVNIGPAHDGTIPVIFQDRLTQVRLSSLVCSRFADFCSLSTKLTYAGDRWVSGWL